MNQTRETIIVYGGSFDPPHRGHAALLKAAIKKIKPSRSYVAPAFKAPFKEPVPVSFNDRFKMTKLALRGVGLEHVRISRFEGNRDCLSYTFKTIRYFRRLHPRKKIYFLMGSDCLAGFGRWKNYRGIIKNAVLLVGARNGFPLKNPSGVPFERLEGIFPEVSSTFLRAALLVGDHSRFLAGPVNGYIEKKGLYFLRERRLLKTLLTPARYSHCLAVARLAAELAGKYGENPRQAALAGLLHDAARDFKKNRLIRYAIAKRLKVPWFNATVGHAPVLLHSYASARLAAERFGVREKAVLRAISLHTLGAVRMDALSKIIYVADLAAEGRGFPEAEKTGRVARRDLDAAFRAANYVKLKHAAMSGFWRHPITLKIQWKLHQTKKD
ncbi:MAG TPA: nicotinate (nicotinamide) nucleotide adenylyltransferase [Elusimicrobia bacterium]|nr:nicotinate (nicotinamide) nucleotide adenylyltransferase [Elusimicrobiota bacterium]